MSALEQVFSWLGQFVIGVGAAAGVAWWIFQTFSEKWLQSKFDTKLEEMKHAQQRELEDVRFELGKLTDRALKLSQHEFDVLPQTWQLYLKAHGAVASAASQLQSYPNLRRMNDGALEEYLAGTKLAEWEKAELRASEDKDRYLRKALNWIRYRDARDAQIAFHNNLLSYRIFFAETVVALLNQLDSIMNGALLEHQMHLEQEIDRSERGARNRLEEIPDIERALELAIRQRLWMDR